ncbi:MAG: hypothetical protein AB1714_25310 [Acidobacteriota bacterium]
MTRRFFTLATVMLVAAAMLTLPATAAAPTKTMTSKANAIADRSGRPIEPPDFATLPELKPLTAAEERAIESSPQGKFSLYWNVRAFACAYGGRIYIAVNNRWKGYVTRNGKYYVGRYTNGRYIKLYAEDYWDYTYWGPATYYIYSYWSKFTWKIIC